MKGVHVGMVLPKEMVRAVDTFARQQSAEVGVKWTRSDAVRVLLAMAIEQLKKEKEKHAK